MYFLCSRSVQTASLPPFIFTATQRLACIISILQMKYRKVEGPLKSHGWQMAELSHLPGSVLPLLSPRGWDLSPWKCSSPVWVSPAPTQTKSSLDTVPGSHSSGAPSTSPGAATHGSCHRHPLAPCLAHHRLIRTLPKGHLLLLEVRRDQRAKFVPVPSINALR